AGVVLELDVEEAGATGARLDVEVALVDQRGPGRHAQPGEVLVLDAGEGQGAQVGEGAADGEFGVATVVLPVVAVQRVDAAASVAAFDEDTAALVQTVNLVLEPPGPDRERGLVRQPGVDGVAGQVELDLCDQRPGLTLRVIDGHVAGQL